MNTAGIVGAGCPYTCFEAFDGQQLTLVETVRDGKTAGAPFFDGRFDKYGIAESRRREKTCARIHEGNAREFKFAEQFRLGPAGELEKRVGAGIEKFKVAREIDNAQRIAIAPLDVNLFFVY